MIRKARHNSSGERWQMMVFCLLQIVDAVIYIASIGSLDSDYAPEYLFSTDDLLDKEELWIEKKSS